MVNILQKIKAENLIGKGGASFPVFQKWESVKKAKGDKKYIICNCSEGEPDVYKDGYLLEHYPEKVIDGIKIALLELSANKAYLFINEKYYKKYSTKLLDLITDSNIELFKKPYVGGYIAGEESSLINAIEGNRIEPSKKPPYPSEHGLWGMPTLINNVETFYDISLINSEEYKKNRFYTIAGDCHWLGVYEFSDRETIGNILYETKNYPKFDFFVQVGGGASGEVLNSSQLDREVEGSGSITVYSIAKHKPKDVIKNWLNFFMNESCGQCTPCREGTYRLHEIMKDKEPNWQMFFAILEDLPKTSFCALGKSVPIPIISYFKNVLKNNPKYNQIFIENNS
jgi:NADH:ubiquinone oxidoreductase subunit F (NADH-binding)